MGVVVMLIFVVIPPLSRSSTLLQLFLVFRMHSVLFFLDVVAKQFHHIALLVVGNALLAEWRPKLLL